MTIEYQLVSLALLALSVISLTRLRKNELAEGAVAGFLLGLVYFIVIPLALLSWAGYYHVSIAYGHTYGPWASVSVQDPGLWRPFVLLTLGAATCFLAAWFFVSIFSANSVFVAPQRSSLYRVSVIAICVAGGDWLLRILSAGGLRQFLTLPFLDRTIQYFGHATFANNLAEHLSVANGAVLCACAATHFQSTRRNLGWSIVFFAMLAAQLVLTENRIFFASFLVALVFGFWRAQRMRAIALLLMTLPLLAMAGNAWVWIRGANGNVGAALDYYWNHPSSQSNRFLSTAMDTTESADLLSGLQIIREFGTFEPYLNGKTLERVIMLPMPRELDQDKQQSFSVIAAQLLEPRMADSSMPTTVVAEMYANFGLGFIVALALLSLALTWTVQFTKRHPSFHTPAVQNLAFILGFWAVRSAFADVVGFGLLALLALGTYEAIAYATAGDSKHIHSQVKAFEAVSASGK